MKNTIWDHLRKKQNITAICVCILGVGLNILLGNMVAALGLPLYLDTVGTVIVAALGGYFPGALVGFITNILKSVSDPSSLYYGVLNVMIAVTATFMTRRGVFRKWFGGVIATLVFTFIGGGIGSLIPWYMESVAFDSESLSGILYQTGLFNQFFAHFFSNLILDLPDKAFTVILVVIVLNLLPKQFRKYCCFTTWMQNPLSDDKVDKKEKRKSKLFRFRNKVDYSDKWIIPRYSFISSGCLYLQAS